MAQLVGAGAVIERSILSPGVFVGPGAVIRESVILNDAYIERGSRFQRHRHAPLKTLSPRYHWLAIGIDLSYNECPGVIPDLLYRIPCECYQFDFARYGNEDIASCKESTAIRWFRARL